MNARTPNFILIVCLLAKAASGGDLAFSDPANVRPMPAWAVGQANRAPDLDVLPGFQKPPPGFGIVPFFWWLGDPLTKERLGWELEQMAGMGVSGLPDQLRPFRPGRAQLRADLSERAAAVLGGVVEADRLVHAGGEETGRRHQPERLHARLRPGLVRGRNPARASPGECTWACGCAHGHRTAQVTCRETVPWSLNPMHPHVGQVVRREVLRPVRAAFPRRRRQGAELLLLRRTGVRRQRQPLVGASSPRSSRSAKATTSRPNCRRCSRTSARARRRSGSITATCWSR